MSIIFNEKNITNVLFNGEKVDNIIYNDQIVFTKTYEILEYIESTGTQYIKTGITLRNDTIFEIDTNFTKYVDGSGHGAYGYYGVNGRCHVGVQNDSTIHCGIGGNATNININNINNRNTYKINETNLSLYINNEYKWKASSSLNYYVELFLFRINSTDSSRYLKYAHSRLFSCNIWNGDNKVREYIPVRRISDGNIGLFDKINNVFYENNGNGTFNYGEVIGYL